MPWLRVDDGFTDHPKIVALGTPGRRWTWLRILSYTARYRSAVIPAGIRQIVPEATAKYLGEAVDIGLIDRAADGTLTVHDWLIYNGATIADKVAHYLAGNPEASANEVCRALGGTREIVLSEVAKQRAAGSEAGSDSGSGYGSHEPPVDGTAEPGSGGSESGTHAREPVPSPTPRTSKAVAGTTPEGIVTGTLEPAAAALDEDDSMPDKSDPVVRLLLGLGNRDSATERVLRAFVGRVPEAAFDYTRDEIDRSGGGSGKAVRILQRIEREGVLVSPDDQEPASAGNGVAPDPATWPERYVHASYRLPDDELAFNLRERGVSDEHVIGWLKVASDLRNARDPAEPASRPRAQASAGEEPAL
jgi:hypothetical protein